MRFGLTANIYGFVFTKLLKDYCKNNYPNTDFNPVKRAIMKEYKAMIERTPGIGGNINESNLIGACFFFSMAKANPNLTPLLLDEIIDYIMRSNFMKKVYNGKKKKGTVFSEKVQNKKIVEAKKSHNSIYKMDWEFTYEKKEDEFYCTYTKCGVCKLAAIEHVEEFLPCMCKMDYAKFELLGAELIRTKTLSNGDECCNFHVIKNEK